MRKSPIKLNDICWKKKKNGSHSLSNRTQNVFIFTSPRSRTRFHALGRVLTCESRYRSRNFAGREKTKRNEQPERSKEKEREELYWNIYWKVDFPAHPEITAGKIRKAEETKRPGRKRSRYFAERKTRDHGFCRGECIPHLTWRSLAEATLRNSRRISGRM